MIHRRPGTQVGCAGANPGELVHDAQLKVLLLNQAARRQLRQLLLLFNIPDEDI